MIQILGFLLIGVVIGVLARVLRPGKQSLSMMATIGVGLVAALIGGVVATLIGSGSLDELNFIGFVVAVIAAIVIIPIAESISKKG
ncbi:GlsB/YeaQ/YmgE family stress response membrane protein [Nocardioides daejeonensis]|uniref:GlsB/YeaQ/YmgE family stress response membrane protein n=1 Tax=Nocardioides daejeonensis TaxID=1046556 RepID=UPI001EF52ABB|nr:hypothetical protein [Nocardioides daejeonensis]